MASPQLSEQSMVTQLRHSLVQLYWLLSSLNPSQRQKIEQLERKRPQFQYNEEMFSKSNRKTIFRMIELSSVQELAVLIQSARSVEHVEQFFQQINPEYRQVSQELKPIHVYHFGCLFRVLLLQEILYYSLTAGDIISIMQMIPSCYPDHKLKLLQQLQIILCGLSKEQMETIFHSIRENPSERQSIIDSILMNMQDSVELYQPLSELFKLPQNQMERIHQTLPKFQDIQLVQLVKILQMDARSILEIRQILSPPEITIKEDVEMTDEDVKCNQKTIIPEIDVSLQIISQLPNQAVYKRNLRPYPSVLITGDDRYKGDIFRVVPVVYRCDTLEPIPHALNSDHSQTGTIGSILKFRKIKIQVTSRQIQDALFCIRFEIYKESIGIVNMTQSNPIQIVSHSSLIKNDVSKVSIKVNEIVPSVGPSSGGTRVAILGSGFNDVSSLTVRFGNFDIVPEIHGNNTLICTTPPNFPSTVDVTILAGNTEATMGKSITFTYESGDIIPHKNNNNNQFSSYKHSEIIDELVTEPWFDSLLEDYDPNGGNNNFLMEGS